MLPLGMGIQAVARRKLSTGTNPLSISPWLITHWPSSRGPFRHGSISYHGAFAGISSRYTSIAR